uniref:HECT-type E3 ubiquitin transferase n=1 Tax=Rhizophora mucronata TaxID=61149 RepID=A0A2P2MVD7_RHIMU
METRSRKRAEASSTAPASSSSRPTTRSHKRSRLSSTAAAAAANSSSISITASAATPSIPTTRSRPTRSHPAPMDPTTPVESTSRTRRGRNESSSDKGKEKEHEVMVRENRDVKDRDRDSLGLNMDSGNNNPNDDDDNDSEGGGIGTLHQNLTSASSALQGLLRKLGAGLDDLLPSSGVPSGSSSHQSGRLKKILSGLRADGEEGKQVEALTQLCDMLSIGTEESLSTFSVDSFVPVLVGLLNHENNPDIMLLAARAITHLCDVLPSSCTAVVHYNAVPCFVARLLTIEYMDLAEQVSLKLV